MNETVKTERDPAKGAFFAECIARLTLDDLIDLVCLKATLEYKAIRIKVTNRPGPKRVGA